MTGDRSRPMDPSADDERGAAAPRSGAVRPALSGLAVAFTAYLAVGAMVWTGPIAYPIVQIIAVAFFLVTTWVCIFWNARGARTRDPVRSRLGERTVLPHWAIVLALLVAAIVPSASWVAAGPDAREADYATWSLGAVGALMAIVMVRRRPWTAWALSLIHISEPTRPY